MKKFVSLSILLCFLTTSGIGNYSVYAESMPLPAPGIMVNLSPAYVPVLIKGLKVHPENPFLFDFILDTGSSGLKVNSHAFKSESEKLIKYFLASLTVKEDDLWVNLSPYEKDRMIPNELGKTELGRDMLAQDYILKQLTASLIYPERQLGKEFWSRVYAKAQKMFGTVNVPVNTFNKVWIVADKAKVLERDNAAYVVGAHLKVMLEEDYMALFRHSERGEESQQNTSHTIVSQIVRKIVVPELEKEVNQGQNFATLRQMFYSMILASWYKLALKNALLNQVYSNKAKTDGILSDDPQAKEKIYEQYLQAYKKGVFNYIKEDMDAVSKQTITRKYFSGGLAPDLGIPAIIARVRSATSAELGSISNDNLAMATVNMAMADGDKAGLSKGSLPEEQSRFFNEMYQKRPVNAWQTEDNPENFMTRKLLAEWMKSEGENLSRAVVLNIGAGNGGGGSLELTDHRQYPVDRVIHVDISSEAKKQFNIKVIRNIPVAAQNKYEYLVGDVVSELNKFQDSSLDLIHTHLSLMYFDREKTQQIFRLIYSKLKPGGHLIMAVFSEDHLRLREGKLEPMAGDENFYKEKENTNTVRLFTERDLNLFLDGAGWRKFSYDKLDMPNWPRNKPWIIIAEKDPAMSAPDQKIGSSLTDAQRDIVKEMVQEFTQGPRQSTPAREALEFLVKNLLRLQAHQQAGSFLNTTLESTLFQLTQLPVWDESEDQNVEAGLKESSESDSIFNILASFMPSKPSIEDVLERRRTISERFYLTPKLKNEEAINILMLCTFLPHRPSIEQVYLRFRWFEAYISAGYDPINMAIMTMVSFIWPQRPDTDFKPPHPLHGINIAIRENLISSGYFASKFIPRGRVAAILTLVYAARASISGYLQEDDPVALPVKVPPVSLVSAPKLVWKELKRDRFSIGPTLTNTQRHIALKIASDYTHLVIQLRPEKAALDILVKMLGLDKGSSEQGKQIFSLGLSQDRNSHWSIKKSAAERREMEEREVDRKRINKANFFNLARLSPSKPSTEDIEGRRRSIREEFALMPTHINEDAVDILMLSTFLPDGPSVDQAYQRFRLLDNFNDTGKNPVNVAIMTMASFVWPQHQDPNFDLLRSLHEVNAFIRNNARVYDDPVTAHRVFAILTLAYATHAAITGELPQGTKALQRTSSPAVKLPMTTAKLPRKVNPVNTPSKQAKVAVEVQKEPSKEKVEKISKPPAVATRSSYKIEKPVGFVPEDEWSVLPFEDKVQRVRKGLINARNIEKNWGKARGQFLILLGEQKNKEGRIVVWTQVVSGLISSAERMDSWDLIPVRQLPDLGNKIAIVLETIQKRQEAWIQSEITAGKKPPPLESQQLQRVSLITQWIEKELSPANKAMKAITDNAMNGGIDLNGKKMGLDIARQGNGIEMKFNPALIAQFQRGDFSGIVPVIIRIIPISSPFAAA